ncbi:hypothetical protein HDU81_005976 [Chytriomyces hyalinus]|nr:hypothetical protein HDU81_005976 [Chytriomyces hyalinus]
MEEKEAGDTQDAKSSAASRLRSATVPMAALNGGNKASLRAVAELAWRAKRLSSDNLDGTPDSLMNPIESSPAISERASLSALAPKEKFVAATNAVIATQGLAEAVAEKKAELQGPPSHAAVAAAFQKLTGLSVSDATVIPVQLHAPIVNAATAIDAIIDPIKAMIDVYIPFESIVNTLYITTGIFWAWFIGYFNLGIGWVFVIMFFVNAAYRRNFARLKGKIAVENARILGLTKLEKDAETVEWMNVFLHQFWVQFEPSLSKSLFDTINPILASSKPGFLDDLALTEFTLGSTAPRIDVIRTFTQTADDMMVMELALLFVPVDEDDISPRQKRQGTIRQSKVEVVAKLGKGISIPVPVVVAEIEFRANLRLELKFGSKYPYVQRIDYVFTQTPFTLPNDAGKLRVTFNWYPLDKKFLTELIEVKSREPTGAIKFKLLKAKNLINVEMLGRKSNPYAKISLGATALGTSLVKENTLDPVWNENFYGVVYSKHQKLNVRLWDYNNLQKDKSLGLVDLSLSDIMEYATLLENPTAEFAEHVKDGFVVEKGPHGVGFHVTCPIYLKKDNSSNENLKEAVELDSASVSRNASVVTSAAADGRELAAARRQQRGFLYFEIEYYPVENGDHVPALSPKDYEFIHYQREKTAKEVNRLRALRDVKVLTVEDAEERIKSVVEKGYVGEIDPANIPLLQLPAPEKVFSRHDTQSIVQTLVFCASIIIRGKSQDAINSYVDIRVDNASVFTTQIQRYSTNPTWNTKADICLRSFKHQNIFLVIEANDAEKMGKDDRPIAKWNGNLLDVIGRKVLPLTLEHLNLPGRTIGLEVSIGYVPLTVSLANTTRNSGILYIDLVNASHLDAVDSNGTSDPYCLISLNDELLHKSKVHKKDLNPVFNENVQTPIHSRQNSTLNFVIKDFNVIGKHVTLGTVNVDLSNIDPGQLLNMVLPLAGARSGSLHVKLFFDHQASGLQNGSNDAALTRVGDDDTNAAVKLTKGLGNGTVGVFKELGKTMKGAPRQSQTDLSAAEVAMKLGVTEAEVGSVAVDRLSDIVDPAGTIVLQILGARKLRAVDENGLADPYLLVNQLLHGKVKTLLKTKSQSKTLNPEWNEAVQFKIPPSKITLVIEDKNLFKSSKPMGEIELDIHSLLKDGATSFDTWLQVSLGGMGEVHVKGTFKPDPELQFGLGGGPRRPSHSSTPSPSHDDASSGTGMFKRSGSGLGNFLKGKRTPS